MKKTQNIRKMGEPQKECGGHLPPNTFHRLESATSGEERVTIQASRDQVEEWKIKRRMQSQSFYEDKKIKGANGPRKDERSDLEGLAPILAKVPNSKAGGGRGLKR